MLISNNNALVQCMNTREAHARFNQIIRECLKDGSHYLISTDIGNVLLMTETEYKSLIETFCLLTIPTIQRDIKDSIETPTNAFYKTEPWNK